MTAVGIRAYYNHGLPHLSASLQGGFCIRVYLFTSWLILTSVLGRLQAFLFLLFDRLLAVWKPLYWYRNCSSKLTAYRIIYTTIWLVSAIFAIGEPVVHQSEFSKQPEINSIETYHVLRAYVCLFLVISMMGIWVFTFLQSCIALRRSRRIGSRAQMTPSVRINADGQSSRMSQSVGINADGQSCSNLSRT